MLVNKTFGERYFYLDLIYEKFLPAEDSIRFFARAEEIRQLGKETRDRDLELEADLLELSFLIRNNKKDIAHCVALINKLLNIATAEKNNILLARTHAIAGDFYWGNNYEKAFEHLHAEYDIIKSMDAEQYPLKQKSLYNLGNCYWFFHDYTTTMGYMSEAYNTDAFGQNLYYTLQATNTVGLCHQHTGNLDSADYYFQRANSIAVTVGNDAWDGITSGNIGYDLYLRQQYDKALPLLQKDVELSVKRSDFGSASGSLIIIAEINLANGDIVLARQQAKQAREWVQITGEYGRLKTLYALMNKLEQQQGNTTLAKHYLDSSVMIKDSLAAKFAALQVVRTAQRGALEKEHEAAEIMQRMVTVFTSVIALIAIGIIGFSVVRLVMQFRSNGLRA